MSEKNREDIVTQIDSIVSALRTINYYCEKGITIGNEIAIGYPMHESLDEMILNFMYWKDCINETEADENYED